MSRQSRIAEQIRRELSNTIQLEIRDPRLGMVTISAVDLSRDYSVAKVFFTVLEENKAEESLKVLEGCAGYLRKHLASALSLRALPRLTFFYDQSIDRARHLTSLIDEARANDDAMSGAQSSTQQVSNGDDASQTSDNSSENS